MNNSQKLVRTALLLALAIGVQAIGRSFPQISQIFVGSVVNAALIIAAYSCGMSWGILLGALTPMLAWIIGQLPGPMAPFVPFIMIGNAIFVIFFSIMKDKIESLKYIGVVIAAFIKYAFLSLSASKLIYIFNLGIPKKVAAKLAVMMGVPQLITALIGGFIAIILVNALVRRRVIS
ncbi:ECF transporter S component [Clostridium lundense]|uniref:ECF transporter S component n=1 Tax=Clostridium lundense TaxID=319475 RepID=UPI000487FACE|nr:ECF transporter S component [Clostridium lundense]